MTKIQKLKIVLLLSVFYFLLSGIPVQAANLFFEAKSQEIAINQQFQIDLLLNAENEEVNAIEGKILFPVDLLELKEIKDGDSIINFWIDKPAIKINGLLVFSGIIPGGFQEVFGPYDEGLKPGKILSLIFQTKKEGEGAIEINETKVLLNDGKGTPTGVKIFNFQFSISKNVSGFEFQTLKDTEPPEPFTPQIARDPNIFEGQWFLVFASQDKGSGVAYYAVHESTQKKEATRIDTKKWIEAESPYVLEDQKLRSYIYVKAIDKTGNERMVTLSPSRPLVWYKYYWIWIIIILVIISIYFIKRILWSKHAKIHE